MLRVAIACDHGGFPLKDTILRTVREGGYEILDLGAFDATSSDYPDFAEKIGLAIASGKAERGVLICGSGVGACIAANKIPGIYAGLCHDTYSAHQGVEHDDMNVLCLGARIIGSALAEELVKAFLAAEFSRDERHLRRVGKVRAIEKRNSKGAKI
jgi:ribose 5-phosphate isomerase B